MEELNANRIAGVSNSTELASWLRGVPEALHAKLARVGLAEQRAAMVVRTVGELLTTFEQRAVVKPATRKAYKQTLDSLRKFLEAETALQAVTAERADAWRQWIASDTATVTRRRGTTDNRLSPATCANACSWRARCSARPCDGDGSPRARSTVFTQAPRRTPRERSTSPPRPPLRSWNAARMPSGGPSSPCRGTPA
ncbi:MAG: hypothetical protein ACKOCW_08010 [Planctomycetaceae bacterium]